MTGYALLDHPATKVRIDQTAIRSPNRVAQCVIIKAFFSCEPLKPAILEDACDRSLPTSYFYNTKC